MLKDWDKKNSDDFSLPKFPVSPRKQEVKVVIALDSALCEMSPVLASWFMSLSPAKREMIIMDAYAQEKLGEDWENDYQGD